MNLKHLTDDILISETKRLVQKERDITSEILHFIKEIDRRKLYCDYGYPSMMVYAVKELNYSEGSAGMRIQAARMLEQVPEIEEQLNNGKLSLTALGKASGFFKRENINDPRKKRAILKKLENQTTRECDKTLFSLSPNQNPLPKESLKVISSEFHQLKINLTDSTLKSLEDLKSIMGMSSFNNDFFEKITKEASENVKRKKFKLTIKPRSGISNGRYISNETKREVSQKCNGVCEKCGSLFMLQFDHREPYALGGKTESSNLRLLCFNCNHRARIRAKL